MSVRVCAEPPDLAVLLDYWVGDLAAADEERLEEHLLACSECSVRMDGLVALAGGVRRAASLGVVRAVVTGAFLDRLIEEGLRVREYRLVPGGRVECTVTANDDLVAARLAADVHGAQRVDLVRCDADGREQARLNDIPVSGPAQEVVLLERIDRIRALPACVRRVKLVAPDAAGERVLAEYTFVHTPSHD